MIRPARALLHPLFLGALLVLAVNDWVLKGALGPSLVTGKASDFAGLLVAQALVATLFRARSRRAFVASSVVLGLGFAALKTSSVASHLYERLLAFVHASNVVDPTDLVALAVLPLGYRVFRGAMERCEAPPRRLAEALALFAALPFCIATSAPTPVCEEGSVGQGSDCIVAFTAGTFVYNAGSTVDTVQIRDLSAPLPRDGAPLGCSLREEDFGPPRILQLAPGEALPLGTVPADGGRHVALVDLGVGFPTAVFSAQGVSEQRVPGSGWGGNRGGGAAGDSAGFDAPLRLTGGLGIDRYAPSGDVLRGFGAQVTPFRCAPPLVDAATLPEGGFDASADDASADAMDGGTDDAGDGA